MKKGGGETLILLRDAQSFALMRFYMKILRLVNYLAILLTGLMMGCVQLVPHRNQAPTVSLKDTFKLEDEKSLVGYKPTCASSNTGEVNVSLCGNQIREDADDYRLYFTEYDDQGWSYQQGSKKEPSHIFSTELYQLLKDNSEEKVSVVVFVHGWKHNASASDGNVKSFRLLLSDLDRVERQSACGRKGIKRRVIGVYVGWRGRTSDLGFLENATFWNRKEAAQRVALGDVRMLFSDLREMQEKANVKWNSEVANVSSKMPEDKQAASLDPCAKRMKLSIAGHSFGGLIVYTSMAQSLVRDIVALKHDEIEQTNASSGQRVQPLLQRQGDLIVIINPAIEATRFHPLFRAVQEANLPRYYSPVFVSITSKADIATRRTFPVGRWLSTFWDKYPADRHDEEKQANLYTFGHANNFVTHDLGVVARSKLPSDSHCKQWNKNEKFETKLNLEYANLQGFHNGLNKNNALAITDRYFCGIEPMKLTARKEIEKWAGNSPIWNISAEESIIEDHNDFMNYQLLELLRQLYAEVDQQIIKK